MPAPPAELPAMRQKSHPPRQPKAVAKGQLHPRNRHQGRYDFPKLIEASPELGRFVILNPYGKQSIDFADPEAVRVFNRALMRQLYGITHWDIPPGYLCPPIPGRADYLHGLADLLAGDNQGNIPRGEQIRALDVGTGASCIYPLLGHGDYGWSFLGSDIDEPALASAQAIVRHNGLAAVIALRQQHQRGQIFKGLLHEDERFELTLCNPPFHASAAEAASGSTRKWKNLGKLDPQRALPTLNFGGQSAELWCTGGEASFLKRMIAESVTVADHVLWFSSLVSKISNVAPAQNQLKKAGAVDVRCIDMAQGNKQSRFVAWTFHTSAQREAWLQARQVG